MFGPRAWWTFTCVGFRTGVATEDDAQTKNGRSDIDFLDAPSDLVPGVYEGGLKTWECSLDLVDCLDTIYGPGIARDLKGKRILEVCAQQPLS